MLMLLLMYVADVAHAANVHVIVDDIFDAAGVVGDGVVVDVDVDVAVAVAVDVAVAVAGWGWE